MGQEWKRNRLEVLRYCALRIGLPTFRHILWAFLNFLHPLSPVPKDPPAGRRRVGMRWFRSNIRLGSRLALFALAVQMALSLGHVHLLHHLSAMVGATTSRLGARRCSS